MTKAIEDFFYAWTQTDADTRTGLITGAFAQGAFYADPRTENPLTDVAAISEYVGMFSQMAPSMPVSVTNVSTTLTFARATVLFGTTEQGQNGQYIVDLDGDGKITRMVGFAGMGAA